VYPSTRTCRGTRPHRGQGDRTRSPSNNSLRTRARPSGALREGLNQRHISCRPLSQSLGCSAHAACSPSNDPITPPLEHRLAPVIDADRTPLRAVRHKRREQIGELGVPTVLPHEPLHVVPLASPARLADDRQDRDRDLGQDLRAIAGA
jgi:hypothetical protein